MIAPRPPQNGFPVLNDVQPDNDREPDLFF